MYFKGILIHITHYDPAWLPNTHIEVKFDMNVGLKLIDSAKKAGLNTVIVDIKDGVIYSSHPELKRHYSVPMEYLKTLANRCMKLNMEFIPKLNFSKSVKNQHDKWMSPYWNLLNFVNMRDDYFRVAKDIMNEIISTCGNVNYFHLGMNEDHQRSLKQFITDIKELDKFLKTKNIRSIIWNDGCYLNRNVVTEVHTNKSMAAAPLLPNDIIQVLWNYDLTHPGLIKKLVKIGIEIWLAPGCNKKNIEEWKKLIDKEKGNGMLLTTRTKDSEHNVKNIIKAIKNYGTLY